MGTYTKQPVGFSVLRCCVVIHRLCGRVTRWTARCCRLWWVWNAFLQWNLKCQMQMKLIIKDVVFSLAHLEICVLLNHIIMWFHTRESSPSYFQGTRKVDGGSGPPRIRIIFSDGLYISSCEWEHMTPFAIWMPPSVSVHCSESRHVWWFSVLPNDRICLKRKSCLIPSPLVLSTFAAGSVSFSAVT